MSPPLHIETSRLQLRWLEPDDAHFILDLVNDPAWLRFIGDRQVSSLSDARAYIENGPQVMYRETGHGLNRVALHDGDIPIGICGLLQRESLAHSDLGFALLPDYRGHGYAFEAAISVVQHGFEELGKKRIVAIVNASNRASISLLKRVGFQRQETLKPEPNGAALDLYSINRET